MKLSEQRLMDAVHKLCAVSDHLAERVNRDAPPEDDLRRSFRRRQALVELMQESGWMPTWHSFGYKETTGCNAVFCTPDANGVEFMVGSHSDYCAGLGVNDNITGMAVTAEVARVLADTEAGKHCRFATFDMEERGLVGSDEYVKCIEGGVYPRPARVLNVDAVSGKDLFVTQLDGNQGLVGEMLTVARKAGVTLSVINGQEIGISSDHLSFLKRKIQAATIIGYAPEAHAVLASKEKPEDKRRKLMDELSTANKPTDTLDRLVADNLVKSARLLLKMIVK